MNKSPRKKLPSGKAVISKGAARSLKIAIVVSSWHPEITESLFKAASATLLKNGCSKNNILRYDVPGSFELVFAAKEAAQAGIHAVICLGCVVKGETPHFDYICQGVSYGITNLNIIYNIPFIFGVLTTNTLKQAKQRAGGKFGNKGEDAATAALEMIELKKKIVVPI